MRNKNDILFVFASLIIAALCLFVLASPASAAELTPDFSEPPVGVHEMYELEYDYDPSNAVTKRDHGFVCYRDIGFDMELQKLLWSACDETGCPYELAISVIYTETRFQNITGDSGESAGYMQVQQRWHQDRMDRLGVTDLNDPLSNFRVGCDLLAELLDKYTAEEALTAYNTGKPDGGGTYADKVIGYMNETFG